MSTRVRGMVLLLVSRSALRALAQPVQGRSSASFACSHRRLGMRFKRDCIASMRSASAKPRSVPLQGVGPLTLLQRTVALEPSLRCRIQQGIESHIEPTVVLLFVSDWTDARLC